VILGVGSYGAVIDAQDLQMNRNVAIKKVQNIIDEVNF
jgi:hypothetical protein